MDVFDTMPLNMAHSYERKAERLKKKAKWDEAKKMYDKAVEKFNEAMLVSSNRTVLSSLEFQRDYFIRQRDEIDTLKKSKEEKCTENVVSESVGDEIKHEKDYVDYSSLVQPDSLMQPYKPASSSRKKFPKAESDKIEELQIQNQELRNLVNSLLAKIDALSKKNSKLKEDNVGLKEENERLLYCTDMQRQLILRGGKLAEEDEDCSDIPLVEIGGDCFNFESVVNELSNAIDDDDGQ